MDLVARGEYLVRHVSLCGDCHTPIDLDTGAPDPALWLAGNPAFIDIDPLDPDFGLLPSKNLTAVAGWAADQIKDAFQNGNAPSGPLAAVMPYWVFHNMSDADADAIVAYLQSLDFIENVIPARQDPWNVVAPAPPIADSDIPQTTLTKDDPDYESAVRGRYLTGMASLCADCHTPELAPGSETLVDYTMLFAGGRAFPREAFGLGDPWPALIYTRNITPHATGIAGWTAAQVRIALQDGTDDDGDGLCPPMPSGPMGAFAGMTDEDAIDIGNYITTMPGIDNTIAEDCVPPG